MPMPECIKEILAELICGEGAEVPTDKPFFDLLLDEVEAVIEHEAYREADRLIQEERWKACIDSLPPDIQRRFKHEETNDEPEHLT